MKALVFVLSFGLSLPAVAGESLRCAGDLVGEGATTFEVLSKCGPPALRETILVQVKVPVVRAASTTTTSNRRGTVGRASQRTTEVEVEVEEQVVYKPVERWTINQGEGTLLRYMEFEEGRVVRILVGDRAPDSAR